jgi:uncharacterized protein (TIGR03000 family)
MLRFFLISVAILSLSSAGLAQFRVHSGGFGGGPRPAAPAMTPTIPVGPLPTPILPAINPIPRGLGGGFAQPIRRPAHPFPPFWGGYGGWFPYYGYGASNYSTNVEVNQNAPVIFVQPGQAETRVELSGESTSVLTLTFPAPAEIWVNDKKGPGEANDEWTLTSPPIAVGSDYTFKIKAHWKVDGKTFEYEKTIAVAAGNRSRSLVLSGSEVKQ